MRAEKSVREPLSGNFPRSGLFPRLPVGSVGAVVFTVELLGIVALSVVTGIIYHAVIERPADVEAFFAIGVVAFIYYAVILAYRDGYTLSKLSFGWRQMREVAAVWSLVCLFLLSIAFLLKIGPNLSRGATISFFVAGSLFLVIWRSVVAAYLRHAFENGAFAEQKAIVIGDPELLARTTLLEQLASCGYRPAKVVPFSAQQIDTSVDSVVLAARSDPAIGVIFLLLKWQAAAEIEDITRRLSVLPLPIRLLPDSHVAAVMQRPIVQAGSLWAAELRRSPLSLQERFAKRVFDLILASVALVLLLPLMLLVALLVKYESPGPVFFRQTRAGFNNRPFRILKFRTLKTMEDGPVVRQVQRNDHRLTRVGRLLRRTSIDELPQLVNVLRGEMSLVGPRPHAEAHNSEYGNLIGNYAFRHHVKPGLTGWAQVHGFRGETTVESMKRRVEYDLWYIDNWSLWLDMRIMLRTVLLLCRQPSAY
jgi:Undecaprenyl-phosphate glucose phosphotransferase